MLQNKMGRNTGVVVADANRLSSSSNSYRKINLNGKRLNVMQLAVT